MIWYGMLIYYLDGMYLIYSLKLLGCGAMGGSGVASRGTGGTGGVSACSGRRDRAKFSVGEALRMTPANVHQQQTLKQA